MPQGRRIAPPYLVADVGGTHCRFAVVDADGRVEALTRFRTASVDGPLSAVRVARGVMGAVRPSALGLAIAAPLTGDRVDMVNAQWRFSIAELAAELELPTIAINDFVAQSYALACLDASALERVGTEVPARPGPKVVIGPGTGLGVGILVPHGDGWEALPSEGGHATAAAFDAAEADLFARARARHAHVSWERMLSGPGLELLYATIAERDGVAPAEKSAEEITADPTGATASEAIARFVELLATAASNVALTVNAWGGVYLVGGVLDHLGDRFDGRRFRARFESKGRYEALLAAIPVFRVRDELAPLRGVAYCVARAAEGFVPGGAILAGFEGR